ncbi:MAG: hypothetical protein JO011_10415 [Ktedonobacteraceae bacterium]|nr:hypothetical protein [Ktedonobacteraceae bacterium]
MVDNKSEIVQIRAQIESEYEAAKQGLFGLSSGAARHDFISARAENIGKYHEQLVELIGPEQAISIIANTIWSPTDQGKEHVDGRMSL